jgi:hypothetical protein
LSWTTAFLIFMNIPLNKLLAILVLQTQDERYF